MPEGPDESSQNDPRQAGRDRPAPDESKQTSGWFQLAGIGLEFIASVLVLGWLGWFLDGRWGTTPWLMIAGGALGFAAGLWMLIRTAKQAFKD